LDFVDLAAVGTIRELAIWFRAPECKNLGWQTLVGPSSREFRHKRPQFARRALGPFLGNSGLQFRRSVLI
jgi:hypothetical protein